MQYNDYEKDSQTAQEEEQRDDYRLSDFVSCVFDGLASDNNVVNE